MRYRIGVDSGGTCSDCVAADEHGGRTVSRAPTTPGPLQDGVLEAVAVNAEQLGLSRPALLAATDRFVHGTTRATSAMLTRTGARSGLITLDGRADGQHGDRREPRAGAAAVPPRAAGRRWAGPLSRRRRRRVRDRPAQAADPPGRPQQQLLGRQRASRARALGRVARRRREQRDPARGRTSPSCSPPGRSRSRASRSGRARSRCSRRSPASRGGGDRRHAAGGRRRRSRLSAPLADVVDLVLAVTAGDYLIEQANPRHEHEWTVWNGVRLPEGSLLAPGVVSHHTNVVERIPSSSPTASCGWRSSSAATRSWEGRTAAARRARSPSACTPRSSGRSCARSPIARGSRASGCGGARRRDRAGPCRLGGAGRAGLRGAGCQAGPAVSSFPGEAGAPRTAPASRDDLATAPRRRPWSRGSSRGPGGPSRGPSRTPCSHRTAAPRRTRGRC